MVLILDIPHRFNSLYQKPLCSGPSPYSKQGCDAKKNVSLSLENERSQCVGCVDSNVALLPEQVEGIGKGDIRGQVRFVADIFEVVD